MNALQRINAGEVDAHRHTGGKVRQIGPFTAVGSGQNTPLDIAWFDGSRLPTPAELRELEAFCRDADQPVTLHALSHVAPSLLPLLRAEGYAVSYVLHVYAHDLTHLPERPALPIRPEPDPETWARLSAQGFGEDTLNIMRLVGRHPHVQRFAAEEEEGGQVIATAAMQVTGDVAALYAASTVPDGRGRGAQTALLAHRLHLAREQGAALASVFVTPGTPSERNITRAGFQLAGMRLTFARL